MLAKVLLWQYAKIYRADTWMRHHFTFNGHLLLVVMVAAAVFGVDTKHSNTYQLFIFLLLLLLLSGLSSRFQRLTAQLKRQLPRYGTVDELLTYRINLVSPNKKDYDNLLLIEQFIQPSPSLAQLQGFYPAKKTGKRLAIPSFNQWRRYLNYQRGGSLAPVLLPCLSTKPLSINVSFTPVRRGKLIFDTALLAQPDLLGLYRRLITVAPSESCLILPKRYPVKPLAFSGKRKYQAGGISLASSVGNSQEFMALRHYQHGDPLNKIHWKSFAKQGKLIVKEYQDEYFVRRALLLDTFTESGEENLFEAAVSVAASLAMNEQQNEALLDLMFAGEKTYCFTAGRGVGQLPQLQEVLAQVQASSDESLVKLQQAVFARLGQCSSFLCVLLRWDEKRQRFIQQLLTHSLPVAVFLVHEGQKTKPDYANQPPFFYLLNAQQLGQDLAAIG